MGRTQRQLAETVAAELGISGRKGVLFLQRVLELVAEDLVETERVELRGLGTFQVHIRPKRKTTHPVTGKPVVIPERKGVRYRSSASLRRALNPPKPVRARKADSPTGR